MQSSEVVSDYRIKRCQGSQPESEPGRAEREEVTDKREPSHRKSLGPCKWQVLLGMRWGTTEGFEQKQDRSYTLEVIPSTWLKTVGVQRRQNTD